MSLSPVPVGDYATLQSHDDRELRELVWLHRVNRGVLTTPARPEQWLLSVAHGETEADAYVGAFAQFAAELTG